MRASRKRTLSRLLHSCIRTPLDASLSFFLMILALSVPLFSVQHRFASVRRRYPSGGSCAALTNPLVPYWHFTRSTIPVRVQALLACVENCRSAVWSVIESNVLRQTQRVVGSVSPSSHCCRFSLDFEMADAPNGTLPVPPATAAKLYADPFVSPAGLLPPADSFDFFPPRIVPLAVPRSVLRSETNQLNDGTATGRRRKSTSS